MTGVTLAISESPPVATAVVARIGLAMTCFVAETTALTGFLKTGATTRVIALIGLNEEKNPIYIFA